MKIIIILLLLTTFQIDAEQFLAQVVRVTDGDTVKIVIFENVEIRVRLYGIDAPEREQQFGEEATQFLYEILNEQTVVIEPIDTDHYGRLIAIIYTQGICINSLLIQNGLAWVYTQYCDEPYLSNWNNFQLQAQNLKLNIWGVDNQIAPWEYRSLQ